MVNSLVLFIIVASLLTVGGVLFFVLVVIRLNSQQVREHEKHRALRIQMQDQTMAVVAREVHDNIKQLLFVVRKNISSLEEGSSGQKKVALLQTGEVLDKMILDVGAISSLMNPNMVMQAGLKEAFSHLERWLNRSGNPAFRFRIHCANGFLTKVEELGIFRVAQEAIQNAIRHAEAQCVTVEFNAKAGDGFHLIIRDDGKGFLQAAQGPPPSRRRMGLQNMQERAHLLKAQFRVDYLPGEGTVVRLSRSTSGSSE